MRNAKYRIDIRFQADRVLVSIDGAPGPEGDRHLSEVRAAAERCGLEMVLRPRRRDASPPPSLRAPKRAR